MGGYTHPSIRKEIIRLYKLHQYSEKQIADALELTPSTVHYWIQKYHATGHIEHTAAKTGRPRKTNFETDEEIFKTSSDEPFLPATDIRKILNLTTTVCPQTIRNRLHEYGLRSRRPVRKEYLRDIHKQKRLAFALNYQNWLPRDWDRVVFSDEKVFCSSGFGPPRVWRPILANRFDEKYVASMRKSGRFSISVWACISNRGHNRIHLITRKTLDRHYYVRHILNRIVRDDIYRQDEDIYFMQDRSPIHMSRKVKDWIDNNPVSVLEDWPPKGADMNPIENLWAEMERLLKDREVRDQNELWLQVSQAFDELTAPPASANEQSYIQKLVDSMNDRLVGVITRNGGWSKY